MLDHSVVQFYVMQENQLFQLRMNSNVLAVINNVEVSVNIHSLKYKMPHILVTTPSCCLSLIKSKPSVIETKNIEYLIIDHCDHLLNSTKMRSEFQNIFYELPRKKQVMMFSRTMSDFIKQTCRKFLQDQIEIFVRDNSPLQDLQQFHIKIEENKKISVLIQLLDQYNFNKLIIFVRTESRAKCLSKYLNDKNHDNIFNGRNQDSKERVQNYSLFQEGKKRILVTYKLYSKSLCTGVNLIINFDMPLNPDEYMERVCFADYLKTKCQSISFVSSEEDEKNLANIQSNLQTQIKEYIFQQETQ